MQRLSLNFNQLLVIVSLACIAPHVGAQQTKGPYPSRKVGVLPSSAVVSKDGFSIRPLAYKGWPHCYELTNGRIRCVVSAYCGGNMYWLGFVDGENMLYHTPDVGKMSWNKWQLFQGHEAWLGPQSAWKWPPPRGVSADSYDVLAKGANWIQMRSGHDPKSGVTMTKEYRMTKDDRVTITTTITNTSKEDVAWDIWNLTRIPSSAVILTPEASEKTGSFVHDKMEATKTEGVMKRVDGQLQFTNPKMKGGQKFFIEPESGLHMMTGDFGKEKLHVLFRTDRKALPHVEHKSIEIYFATEFSELEVHGPFTRLKPGEKTSTSISLSIRQTK